VAEEKNNTGVVKNMIEVVLGRTALIAKLASATGNRHGVLTNKVGAAHVLAGLAPSSRLLYPQRRLPILCPQRPLTALLAFPTGWRDGPSRRSVGVAPLVAAVAQQK